MFSLRGIISVLSWKPAASLSLRLLASHLQARKTSSGFDAWTEHTVGLQAASISEPSEALLRMTGHVK